MPTVITYVTTDTALWGAGKGAPLTAREFDENNWTLWEAIQDAIAGRLAPAEIANITSDGSVLTIYLSDGSDYAVAMPVAVPRTRFKTEAAASFTAGAAYANKIIKCTGTSSAGVAIVLPSGVHPANTMIHFRQENATGLTFLTDSGGVLEDAPTGLVNATDRARAVVTARTDDGATWYLFGLLAEAVVSA